MRTPSTTRTPTAACHPLSIGAHAPTLALLVAVYALIELHAAAARWNHVAMRDDTRHRMWLPARTRQPAALAPRPGQELEWTGDRS